MAAQPLAARAPRATIEPDLPLADAARLTFAIAVAAMMYYETAAIAGEIEPLHQMRVATRRLRAIVQLFASALHGSRVHIYKRDLPWVGQAAGAVRECDVIEALIRECGSGLDPALAGALKPLCDSLAADRTAAHSRFVAELHTKRYTRMCGRLANPLLRRALPTTDAGQSAPAMIAPIASSARKAGQHISQDAPPELFHRLRVRVKRLRYGLEMLSAMGGKRSRKALQRLEQMQELLGLHQDAVVTMAWLRGYAGTTVGAPPETLMAAGAMLEALIVRRKKLAARACRQWRKIERSNVMDDALGEISRAAEQRLESGRQALADAAPAERIDAGPDAQADASDATTLDGRELTEATPSEKVPPLAEAKPHTEGQKAQQELPIAQVEPGAEDEHPLAESVAVEPVTPTPDPAATSDPDDSPSTTLIPTNG